MKTCTECQTKFTARKCPVCGWIPTADGEQTPPCGQCGKPGRYPSPYGSRCVEHYYGKVYPVVIGSVFRSAEECKKRGLDIGTLTDDARQAQSVDTSPYTPGEDLGPAESAFHSWRALIPTAFG
ncbi:MAG: hypothetical protein OES09_05555 [Gammaproteobacteria bacterium]|nr:hypothetical protein [Gammaproteobacteria bacterium]